MSPVHTFQDISTATNHRYYTLMSHCVFIHHQHTLIQANKLSGLISDKADEQIWVELWERTLVLANVKWCV